MAQRGARPQILDQGGDGRHRHGGEERHQPLERQHVVAHARGADDDLRFGDHQGLRTEIPGRRPPRPRPPRRRHPHPRPGLLPHQDHDLHPVRSGRPVRPRLLDQERIGPFAPVDPELRHAGHHRLPDQPERAARRSVDPGLRSFHGAGRPQDLHEAPYRHLAVHLAAERLRSLRARSVQGLHPREHLLDRGERPRQASAGRTDEGCRTGVHGRAARHGVASGAGVYPQGHPPGNGGLHP